MTSNAFRIRRTFAAALTGIGVLTLTGFSVGAASAAPAVTPTVASSIPTASPEGAILKDTRLTFVNKSDITFSYTPWGTTTKQSVVPGQSVTVQGDGASIVVAAGGTMVQASAFNHGIGTPEASGTLTIGSDTRHRAEHQGENEFDKLVELHGLELNAYRHADSATKNFTVTLEKHSAAQMSLDNTASTRNTFVYVGGHLTPVKKHASAQLPNVERGKNQTLELERGGQPMSLQVTWTGNVAHFGQPGRLAVALADGQQATFGYVTVVRDDTGNDATTTYTLRVAG
ncbi:MAG: hypothetical protein QG597_3282 [Actinomycetota bacterium]|nr:hypothetical protein [Actinomycetota bacterium]